VISTHVLDAALGRPAAGVPVTLTVPGGVELSTVTDDDGRVGEFVDELTAGRHTIRFDTATYFVASGQQSFYPEVVITFVVTAGADHYHVPLLLAPYAYSTYRGS